MPYQISIPQFDATGAVVTQPMTLHSVNSGGRTVGSFITQAAYAQFINNYFTTAPIPADTQIVAVKFNRHILELLMAFPGCESLVFVNAKKPGTAPGSMTDTITVVAVNDAGVPLGWDPSTGTASDPATFAAIEWGQAITKAQAVGTLVAAPLSPTKVDFQQLFTALDQNISIE